MEAGLPDVDTEYNVEGRAAHKLAAEVLEAVIEANSLAPGIRVWGAWTEIEVELKDGGSVRVPVTDEMWNAVWDYVSYVWDAFVAMPHPKSLYIEHKISLAKLNPPEEMFGTADAILVAPAILRIVDLKYGTGVVVEVARNPQLMEYALGAMLSVPHEGTAMWADTMFVTAIVQPRAPHPDGPVREHEYNYDEIRAFGHELMNAAKKANDPTAPLTPGPWCRWCKAAAFCPALLKESQAVAQQEFGTPLVATAPNKGDMGAALVANEPRSPAEVTDVKFEVLTPDPDRISIGQALMVLEKSEMVEGFLAAVRERIREEIRAGREVPGWKLVAGRPGREWVSEAALERWAMEPGVEIEPGELYEKVLRSPAQIEKIVGKKNLPADLYRKVSKSEKLVRVDDARPALPSSAQKEFAALPPATDHNQTPGGGTGDVD